MTIREAVLSAALILTVTPAWAAPSRPSTAGSFACKTAAVAVTSADSTTSTDGTVYTDVSDGAATFKQERSGCITVAFTAVALFSKMQTLVRALLDGVEMFPGELEFAVGESASNTASWVGNVGAGSHTVQIQFRSATDGVSVFISTHSLEVGHK